MIISLLSGCISYRAQPLTQRAVDQFLGGQSRSALVIAASEIAHPRLKPRRIDFKKGLGPDDVAILAVVNNPQLRTERDKRGLAAAQTLIAGILPNPSLGYSLSPVTGGNTIGTVTGYGFTGSWDISSVVSRDAKVRAAKANAQSVELGVAWTEWQTAEAAKLAWYRVRGLQAQVRTARDIEQSQHETVGLLQKAVSQNQKTILDLAAAQAVSSDALATLLGLEQELVHQRLELNRAVGLPPAVHLPMSSTELKDYVAPPGEKSLSANLEHCRLDLLGLRIGYESQEEGLRAAVLAQLPKINLGFAQASDTTPVQTIGFAFTVDLPIFDRNQGNIASAKATRQSLFDEYLNRVFQGRADLAQAEADLRSLNDQVKAAEAALRDLSHLVEIAQEALNTGSIDVLAFAQAKINYDHQRILLLKLKQQLQEARIAIELASGCYLDASRS